MIRLASTISDVGHCDMDFTGDTMWMIKSKAEKAWDGG